MYFGGQQHVGLQGIEPCPTGYEPVAITALA